MASFNDLFTGAASSQQPGDAKSPRPKPNGDQISSHPMTGGFDDETLLDVWDRIKKESFENRWTFERQWQRNVWYVLGRQWIEYLSRYGGWRDKRMAAWIPRPVTNKCKETVQAIRAMFSAIQLGVNVRPNGTGPENVAVAAQCDALNPVLHAAHDMDHKQREADFWLITCGNSFFHTYVDYDMKHGTIVDPTMQCAECGKQVQESTLTGMTAECPECGSPELQPAVDPNTGEPLTQTKLVGRPTTMVLSPLELAFPNSYPRFEELPYVVRMRWRTRRYFESNPAFKDLIDKIPWTKTPQDHSLALFQSLAKHNDMGITPVYWSEGTSTGGDHEDGVTEYEIWMKPCDAYPEGLVFRIVGEQRPVVVHLEDTEALPGPLPYKDAMGKPLFTFAHAAYEHVGGRILASGPIDIIIQKQDQLNQLDSMLLLIIQRMANPVWLEPKGAEIQKLTGMPGLVIKWNPLTVGGNAKPERIPGVGPDASLFTIREQYLRDIEELAGTYDVIKGTKPTGVEAFSALQLLVERSQARFASTFQSRGEAYRDWFQFALELEREFGPDERVKATRQPDKSWTFETFKRANLQGSVQVLVEDGTQSPKTSLGMRAALDHAAQLGMLNLRDPDQQYEGLKLFGLTQMVPQLDVHVQGALLKQTLFERFCTDKKQLQAYGVAQQQIQAAQQQKIDAQKQMVAISQADPNAPIPPPLQPAPSPLELTPLKWKPWYDPTIHRQEFMKWANGDRMRDICSKNPAIEQLLAVHLEEIMQAMVQQAQQQAMIQTAGIPQGQPGQAPPQQQGAGRAMQNSNDNSAPVQPPNVH